MITLDASINPAPSNQQVTGYILIVDGVDQPQVGPIAGTDGRIHATTQVGIGETHKLAFAAVNVLGRGPNGAETSFTTPQLPSAPEAPIVVMVNVSVAVNP